MLRKLREQVRETGISAKDIEQIEKIACKNSPVSIRTFHWQEALDSLKMKSAVWKAYLEGANMVRDSIKTASKSIK